MLIDAHNHAFAYFKGVPKRGIYDNMKTAVKTIGIGKERIFNERFLMMMNHFLIEPVACTPASGWEKGQVERQVRTLRKQLFEPTLAFASLEELNQYLQQQCHQLIQTAKHPEERTKTIAERFAEEQPLLSCYRPYEGYHYEQVRISSLSLFSYDGHKYSEPCSLVAQTVALHVSAE